jgi:hypothetical protein
MQRSFKDDRKFRKPGPPQAEDAGEEVGQTNTAPPPGSYRPATTTQEPTAAESTRGRRSADARTLKRYGRTRREVDAFIAERYATKGPKWLAEQLGVRISTVITRARKLGLPPLR